MDYKTRPKINPKIIFKDIISGTKKALVIGKNNSDIIEIFKNKKISYKELTEETEITIREFLNKQEDKKFDVVILNLELCNYNRLDKIIELLVDKGIYAIIRFRNHGINSKKVTKKRRINRIIKHEGVSILKKFYCKYNFVSKKIIFYPFSYYSVYFITREKRILTPNVSFVDKVKKILSPHKKINAISKLYEK